MWLCACYQLWYKSHFVALIFRDALPIRHLSWRERQKWILLFSQFFPSSLSLRGRKMSHTMLVTIVMVKFRGQNSSPIYALTQSSEVSNILQLAVIGEIRMRRQFIETGIWNMGYKKLSSMWVIKSQHRGTHQTRYPPASSCRAVQLHS